MARARNIKPGFFRNEKLGELPPLTRLLYAGLWTVADREGRLEVRPKRLKADLLPYDDAMTVAGIGEAIDALEAAGFLSTWEVGGVRFAQVANWRRHQNPHFKEPASSIPESDPRQARGKPEASPRPAPGEPDSGPADSGFLIPDTGYRIPDTGSKALAPLALPEWLAPEVWEVWDSYRQRKKKSDWTDKAKALSLDRLAKCHAAGHDVEDVIARSIENGWTGLFEPKGGSNGQRRKGAAERVADATRGRVGGRS